jgi:hypothetical protein
MPAGAAAEGEGRACLDKLASLIAGDVTPPAWLADGLLAAASSVGFVARQAARQPGRTELRDRISDMRRAAAAVIDHLEDADVMRTVIAATEDDLDSDRDVWHGLQSLIGRADRTLAIHGLRPGKGRGKHDPGRSGEEACALFVAVAWREVHGAAPPHTNADANEACNALWELATGETLPENSNSTSRWRVEIQDANGKLDAGDADAGGENARRVLLRVWQGGGN